MLTKKASNKVDSLMKELGKVLGEEGYIITLSNINFHESSGSECLTQFELNLEINGFMEIQ